MKKLMVFAVMLALVLVVTVPALGQVFDTESESETRSADIGLENAVTSEGDNSNQCTPGQQFGNTASPHEHLDVVQYASELDDLEVEGGGSLNFIQYASDVGDVEVEGGTPLTFESSQESECAQAGKQAAAAG